MVIAMPTARVVVADDHPFFRAGLREVLESYGLEVVGEARDGQYAVELARALKPDIVLMDLHMPRLSGVEATREIVAEHPELPVLILTVSPDDGDVAAALAAGARGYLLKGIGAEELAGAVAQAIRGSAVLDAEVARVVLDAMRAAPGARPAAATGVELTGRELEVLRLLAGGASNTEIGRELYISANTVKQHVANIMGKLGARSRVEAAVLAVRRGMI
jgi:DNA-binding NarL/FixJ family response regulator